jgi:hypothetical protein
MGHAVAALPVESVIFIELAPASIDNIEFYAGRVPARDRWPEG